MNYYYLVASFPTFALEEPVPFTVAQFLEDNASVIAPALFEDLALIAEGKLSEATHPVAQRLWSLEIQLRNGMARMRAHRLQKEVGPYRRDYRGFDATIDHIVQEALAIADPLERERYLDSSRWQRLEEMALTDPFGDAAVICFVLRLRLAERWMKFERTKGQQVLDQTVSDLLAAAHSQDTASSDQ